MFKAKSMILLPLLFFSLCLQAVPKNEKEDRFDSYRDTLYLSRYINIPEHILESLYQTESNLDRPLTGRELVWKAVGFAKEKGEELERARCFACHMKVLTPEGYRRIDQLKVGDAVMSWDDDDEKLILNRIAEIHEADNVAYGELTNLKSDEGTFDVTPEHPFYMPEEHKAREISKMVWNDKLLKLEALTPEGCETALVSRGDYIMRGVTKVRTLSLEKSPNNYIVNGIVVMNKPIHLTFLRPFWADLFA